MFDETKEYEVPNEKGLKTFKKFLKKDCGKEWIETKLIYEPTGPLIFCNLYSFSAGYSNYLREFASENQLRVYEVNPKKSANFAKAFGNRSKTDAVDAKMLYNFHLLLKKEDLNIPEIDETTEQLGSFIGSYEILQKTRTILSNHLHSMEYKSGIDTELKESIKKEINHLKQIEEDLEREMKTFAENNPKTREVLDNLLSIKGIGVISAIALLYLFKKYPDINRNETTALAGLDPVRRQSGSSLNGGRKRSRAGDPMLRKVLYLSCMNSIQHSDRIRMFYEPLVANNHKKPKVALVACMIKILLGVHQIYVNKSKYKPLYIDNKNLCLPS